MSSKFSFSFVSCGSEEETKSFESPRIVDQKRGCHLWVREVTSMLGSYFMFHRINVFSFTWAVRAHAHLFACTLSCVRETVCKFLIFVNVEEMMRWIKSKSVRNSNWQKIVTVAKKSTEQACSYDFHIIIFKAKMLGLLRYACECHSARRIIFWECMWSLGSSSRLKYPV